MIETHTVGHPSMTGEPVPTFGKGRVCHVCNRTRLSIYNNQTTCHSCLTASRREKHQRAMEVAAEKIDGKTPGWLQELVLDELSRGPSTAMGVAERTGRGVRSIQDCLRVLYRKDQVTRTGNPPRGGRGLRLAKGEGYVYSLREGGA